MIAKVDPPPSYHNHQHHYIQNSHSNRNQFQSPNPLSASVSASNGAQVQRPDFKNLSASMNDSEKKMDRLTASKSMFEKDKFAESLAKVTPPYSLLLYKIYSVEYDQTKETVH